MKKAWVNSNVVVDVVAGNPADLFHPDVAKYYSHEVADDIRQGAVWTASGWQNVAAPTPAAPAEPTPPTVGPNEFYFLWTVAEQIAIEEIRKADVGVMLFMRRLDDVRTTEVVLADPTVQEAVRHTITALVAAGTIKAEDAEARAATIIAGGRL